jgi:hypothetical protein
MRIRIVTTTFIDTETGEASSTSVWKLEGQEQNLGSHIHQAAAALARLPTPPVVTQTESLEEPRAHPAAKEARLLGGLLEIRDDVEVALGQRPAGRVLEVLKWMRAKRGKETIRNPQSLFWSLVSKD